MRLNLIATTGHRLRARRRGIRSPTWHSKLGRSESPVAGAVGCGVHLQLTRRLGLQLTDGGREVTGQDGRVRPARFGERGRCDVLGRLVQRHADRVGAHLFDCSPGADEELVGPPAEQERVGALVGPGDQRPGLVVARPPSPSAALESVPAVLLRRAAVSLHHSIDGDLRHGRQLHDRGSLVLGAAPRGRPLIPATNTSVPIRHRLADFFRGLSGTPVASDPAARRFRGECAHFLMCAPSADELWDQIDREAPGPGITQP